MANAGSHPLKRDIGVLAAQVGAVWACGSAFMGTVALLFLVSEGLVLSSSVQGASPLVICPECPGPGPSLFALTPVERLAVFGLVAMLFVALAVVVWRTAAATWLASDTRARLLWVVVVGLGGLVGWSFAAVVTFAAGFSPVTQIVLSYTCGGLPFGLVAGMLLRPWRVNAAALAVSAGLVVAGFLMVAGRSSAFPQNVFALYVDYARAFFTHGTNGVISR